MADQVLMPNQTTHEHPKNGFWKNFGFTFFFIVVLTPSCCGRDCGKVRFRLYVLKHGHQELSMFMTKVEICVEMILISWKWSSVLFTYMQVESYEWLDEVTGRWWGPDATRIETRK